MLWPPDPRHPERSESLYSGSSLKARLTLEENVTALAALLGKAEGKGGKRDAAATAVWLTEHGQGALRGSKEELARDLKLAAGVITGKGSHALTARYLLLKDASDHGDLGSYLSSHDVIPEPKTGWTQIGETKIEVDNLSPFKSKITTELFFSPKQGIGVKFSEPVESGYGGEEQQTYFYRLS